jgi:hypothetical protein
MSTFNDIITAAEEELLQQFYRFKDDPAAHGNKLSTIAKKCRIHPQQLICAVGFNPHARYLTEIFPLIGYATYNELSQERNEIFISDIYKRLSLDNVLKIYQVVVTDTELLELMQYLLKSRLEKVEERIEETVNSLVIEKYRAEIRAIYNDGVATIDFAEERLNRPDSGFRALLNEVVIIVESKLIPAGEIFFRDAILPQEKQKLLSRGMIPKELVESRLADKNTSSEEKKVLYGYLKSERINRSGKQ